MVHIEGIDDRMIVDNLEPHYLTHPSEVIKDELKVRGISQLQLAKSIGVPASQLNELLNAKCSLSAEIALLIGQTLGIEPAPLLALQTDYNLLSAKRNKSFLECGRLLLIFIIILFATFSKAQRVEHDFDINGYRHINTSVTTVFTPK